jgi:hypothetical protein
MSVPPHMQVADTSSPALSEAWVVDSANKICGQTMCATKIVYCLDICADLHLLWLVRWWRWTWEQTSVSASRLAAALGSNAAGSL